MQKRGVGSPSLSLCVRVVMSMRTRCLVKKKTAQAFRLRSGQALTGLFVCLWLMIAAPGLAFADKVSLRLADNVWSSELIDELRGTLPDESKPQTGFEAQRQAKRAAESLRTELNTRGYYDPSIKTLVDTEDGFQPIVTIDPGRKFTLESLTVDFLGDAPLDNDAQAARDAVKLNPGDAAIPAEVINQETLITTLLQTEGYPFARAEERQIIGDREAGTLAITYQIDSGPRVRFGDVEYSGEFRTKTSYLNKLIPFERGELYDPAALALYRGWIDETRLFSVSTARLAEEPVAVDEDGTQTRNVVVTLVEKKRHTLEAGISLSTDKGVGVTSELTRRNFTRRGDLLVGSFDISEPEQTLDLEWRRPNEFGYGRGLVFGAELTNEDTDAYERQAFTLRAGYDVREDHRFTYGYGVQAGLVREQDEFGERDLQLIGAYGQASLDRADSVLNATKGWKLDGRIEPSASFGGDETQFVRSVAQIRGYYPVTEDRRLVLAGRLKVGTVFGGDLESLPSASRFFAGGGGSVRGYAYQAIGPRSADATPTGGRSLVETAFEARWQVRPKIGVVGFIDAGSVGTREGPGFSDLRTGAGFGVRYDTVAGPLRVDVGIPLDKQEYDEDFQIYISLGQAF